MLAMSLGWPSLMAFCVWRLARGVEGKILPGYVQQNKKFFTSVSARHAGSHH
jgi:hypothetical protein